METKADIGKITIAPEVLETTVRLTTLAVPGVVRLISPHSMQRVLGQDGVKIEVEGGSLRVKVCVVTEYDANMLAVGRQIQAEVTRAIEGMIGMGVKGVDVHIEDVARFAKG